MPIPIGIAGIGHTIPDGPTVTVTTEGSGGWRDGGALCVAVAVKVGATLVAVNPESSHGLCTSWLAGWGCGCSGFKLMLQSPEGVLF